MTWLADIPSYVWAAVLTPAIIALFTSLASGRQAPDADGWLRVRPTLVVYIFGLFYIPFALLFTAMPLMAVYADTVQQGVVFVVLGPLLACLMWFGLYGTFIARTRFNADGIEYRGLIRTLFVPWKEVRRIGDHSGLGTYVSTNRGRLIVWKFFLGFPQLVEEAMRHGIEVDPSLLDD